MVVTGPTGCGKSAIVTLIRGLHGRAAIGGENYTAASLRDRLATDRAARAVLINEAESAEDNRRLAEIQEMARFVYTRGEGGWGRGGVDAREGPPPDAIFALSAIQPPPVEAQDRNRRIVLELEALKVTPAEQEAFEARMQAAIALGPALRRRVLDQWGRFRDAEARYRRALFGHGVDPRGVDTYGAVLAMADILLLESDRPQQGVDTWAFKIAAWISGAAGDIADAPHQCWQRLLTHRAEAWGSGDRRMIGEYLSDVAREPNDSEGARAILYRCGISVTSVAGMRMIAVANDHAGLIDIYRGTPWAGGGWVTALRRLVWPGGGMRASASSGVVRFGTAIRVRATLIPLDVLGTAAQAGPAEDEADDTRSSTGVDGGKDFGL